VSPLLNFGKVKTSFISIISIGASEIISELEVRMVKKIHNCHKDVVALKRAVLGKLLLH